MKKILFSLVFLLFPFVVFATESLSFTPPASDLSVMFLSNIFGVVDGVLHGTGSQIMGAIFSVFNSAVLALGGIVILYTLLVSTMNTANEGEMLGRKWSSIWVPLRSTLGLALLIPKASGYCLMQIFVMWIILQGVGAADKIWNASLSYLNRGGVIIQPQLNSTLSSASGYSSTCLSSSTDPACSIGEIANGASVILTGQVCMLGLQTILENQRQSYLNSKANNSGPCTGSPPPAMSTFCNTAVPNFISSVNAVTYQTESLQGISPGTALPEMVLQMPNLDSTSPYAFLNGICGYIHWQPYTLPPTATQSSNIPLTQSETQSVQLSRAIAIQQMYIDLSNIAQIMVNNDPAINTQVSSQNDGKGNFSPNAIEQFGVPYTASGQPCTSSSSTTSGAECPSWGPDPSNTSSPLFNGSEFQGAIADYNGVMASTLNLAYQAATNSNAAADRSFIQQAELNGWILAGSYFFDIAKLNAAASANSVHGLDSDTGLGASTFPKPSNPFSNGDCVSQYANVCVWLNKVPDKFQALAALINGNVGGEDPVTLPTTAAPGLTTPYKPIANSASSSVYGFINNSMSIHLPNQPGLAPPAFTMKININIDTGSYQLPYHPFACDGINLPWPMGEFCIGQIIGDVVYNDIFRNVFNHFLLLVAGLINNVILSFLSMPLQGIAGIFQSAVALIEVPNVNPIVALANMGVDYINFANELWIVLITISVTVILIPIFGLFILALIMLAIPLLLAWMGVMVGVGFITAYYIPFVPYMIFTFGSIAWLMVVIEAMVAAPIVALGITHPEGHDAFGKGEHAVMILMNVFLRPSMMIIGYIAAIALAYVSVWIINSGFSNAMTFIQGAPTGPSHTYQFQSSTVAQQAAKIDLTNGYVGWAGIYGFFFSVLIYTTMYMTVVQKAFTLITYLPDKVLRWIGGNPESIGTEAAQWGDDAKQKLGDAGRETSGAQGQIDKALTGATTGQIGKAKDTLGQSGADISATGNKGGSDAGDATPAEIPPEALL